MTATVPSPAAPAAVAASRWERVAAPVWTIAGLGLATAALHVRDPHDSGSWGICPSAALGVWCPGCGGLRAVNDLTNGDVLGAASSNLAFIVVLPFLVVGLAVWAVGRWRGRTVHVPSAVVRPVAYASLALLAVFTVLRNLPAGSWLAP
jgi:hypothetical protein